MASTNVRGKTSRPAATSPSQNSRTNRRAIRRIAGDVASERNARSRVVLSEGYGDACRIRSENRPREGTGAGAARRFGCEPAGSTDATAAGAGSLSGDSASVGRLASGVVGALAGGAAPAAL